MLRLLCRRGLTPVVWEQQQMEWLAAAVQQRGRNGVPLPIHLEIDTGMARQGVAAGEGLRDGASLAEVGNPDSVLDGVIHLLRVAGSRGVGSRRTNRGRGLRRRLRRSLRRGCGRAGFMRVVRLRSIMRLIIRVRWEL